MLQDKLSDFMAGRWVFKAVVYKSGLSKGFVGYGDADPSNVSPMVRGAELRIAETRAVNRALRKAYGIGLCSVEELGAFSIQPRPSTTPSPSNGSHPSNGSGNTQPRLRDCSSRRRCQTEQRCSGLQTQFLRTTHCGGKITCGVSFGPASPVSMDILTRTSMRLLQQLSGRHFPAPRATKR